MKKRHPSMEWANDRANVPLHKIKQRWKVKSSVWERAMWIEEMYAGFADGYRNKYPK